MIENAPDSINLGSTVHSRLSIYILQVFCLRHLLTWYANIFAKFSKLLYLPFQLTQQQKKVFIMQSGPILIPFALFALGASGVAANPPKAQDDFDTCRVKLMVERAYDKEHVMIHPEVYIEPGREGKIQNAYFSMVVQVDDSCTEATWKVTKGSVSTNKWWLDVKPVKARA